MLRARFALSCLILLTQNHLRLTPTISNCNALLSMLTNASLVSVCLSANNRSKTAYLLAEAARRFCKSGMDNTR
ncbi:hypothetical protein [Helicobacter pylori]